jgi:uncharacterized protein YcbX
MHQQLTVGSIGALHRYPVKSMMGEEINATRIGPKGLEGDRVFAIADAETGKIASAKNPSKWPNLFDFRAAFTEALPGSGPLPAVRIAFPDGSTICTDEPEVEARLAATLAKPVRFLKAAPAAGSLEEYWPDIEGLARRDEVTDEAMPAETFFDVGIVHILTTATLSTLSAGYPPGRFETRRFRPNIVIRTAPELAGFPEQDWNDKVLAIGAEVKLKITGPCGRCVMTTLAQGDLPKDSGILRAAALKNEARVGCYASVLQGGMIRRGDAVVLEPAGE